TPKFLGSTPTMRAWWRKSARWSMPRRARGSLKQRARFVDATALDARTRHLLHLSPRAGRGGFASGALAKRSKSGEGALPQPETRAHAPAPPRRLPACFSPDIATTLAR